MQTMIINAATGDVTVRDLTEDELAQREADAAAEAERVAMVEAELAAKEAARVSAMSKLMALGLDDVEVAAIVGSV